MEECQHWRRQEELQETEERIEKSHRKGQKGTFLGVKAAGAWGWQPHHFHVPNVTKSGSLNLLETWGPVTGLYRDFFIFIYVYISTDVALLLPAVTAITIICRRQHYIYFQVKSPYSVKNTKLKSKILLSLLSLTEEFERKMLSFQSDAPYFFFGGTRYIFRIN